MLLSEQVNLTWLSLNTKQPSKQMGTRPLWLISVLRYYRQVTFRNVSKCVISVLLLLRSLHTSPLSILTLDNQLRTLILFSSSCICARARPCRSLVSTLRGLKQLNWLYRLMNLTKKHEKSTHNWRRPEIVRKCLK